MRAAVRATVQMWVLLVVLVVCVGVPFLPFLLTVRWMSGAWIPYGSDAEGPWPVVVFALGLLVACTFGIALAVETTERDGG